MIVHDRTVIARWRQRARELGQQAFAMTRVVGEPPISNRDRLVMAVEYRFAADEVEGLAL